MPSDNDTILGFRLERYDVVKGEPVCSAVYSIHRYTTIYSDKITASVYFRDYSTYSQGVGYDYSDVDVDSALVELSAAADSLHILDFPRTQIDKENKKRSRWLMEISYSSGAKVEIVEYIDQSSTTAEAPVVNAFEPIFKRLAAKVAQPGAFREYSSTTYKSDGKWQRRIKAECAAAKMPTNLIWNSNTFFKYAKVSYNTAYSTDGDDCHQPLRRPEKDIE